MYFFLFNTGLYDITREDITRKYTALP